jgi:hypothetical protein
VVPFASMSVAPVQRTSLRGNSVTGSVDLNAGAHSGRQRAYTASGVARAAAHLWLGRRAETDTVILQPPCGPTEKASRNCLGASAGTFQEEQCPSTLRSPNQ